MPSTGGQNGWAYAWLIKRRYLYAMSAWYAGGRAGAGEVMGGLAGGRAAPAEHARQPLVRQRRACAQEQWHLLCC